MTIPPRFLDEVRNRLTLSDVIGKRISVKRAGREFKACCPFHKEKTPSFTINDDKQFYHCFGCGAHGDAIGFVMQHDNLSFIDALEMLSAEAGLQMPKPDPESIKKAEKAKGIYELLDDATKWFQDQMNDLGNRDVLTYIRERGLNDDTISAFHVGFAPAGRQDLRAYLKGRGYEDAEMIEAGLLKKSDKGEPYVFFRERVMFPVTDRRGRVVAFGGRILPDHLLAPQRGDFTPPKYINSSETPVFDKGRMLYGESIARQAAREGQSVIVTEGYMDVIACYQAGFKGAVAPMGTALTEDQILSLWSMIPDDEKVPILCFDGDNAGRSAASRACERLLPLLKPGHSARFAFLPEGEDPDSLLRSGGNKAFQAVLDSAVSLFDFIWASHMSGRDFETPEARAGVTKLMEKQVALIADRDVQGYYKAQLRAKISETFFAPKKRKSRDYSNRLNAFKLRKPRLKSENVNIQTRILLAAVLNHPHIYESIEEELGRCDIGNESFNRLRQNIISLMENSSDLDREELHNHLKQNGFEQEMSDILNESVYVHAGFVRPGADADLILAKLAEIKALTDQQNLYKEAGIMRKEAVKVADEEKYEQLSSMVRAGSSD